MSASHRSACRRSSCRYVVLALSGVFAAIAVPAAAQPYPSRPIRIVVPGSPGSATDFTARAVGQRLTDLWGQQVVIDNRTGAGGILGHEITAKAAPDGYTLIMSTSAGLVINPALGKVSYQPDRDFTPVSITVINPQMLAAYPGLPAANVSELVALARSKPKQLNCGSPGAGTPNHLGCELLKVAASIDVLHVPYKGTAPAITDLVAGQVHFMFNSMPALLPLSRSGKLKALATGGTKRSPATPDVPTVGETIPGFECINWYALLGPRGMPPAVVAKLNAELVRMFAEPAFAQRFVDQGSEPQTSTPAGLADYMRKESERWTRVVKAAGLKFER